MTNETDWFTDSATGERIIPYTPDDYAPGDQPCYLASRADYAEAFRQFAAADSLDVTAPDAPESGESESADAPAESSDDVPAPRYELCKFEGLTDNVPEPGCATWSAIKESLSKAPVVTSYLDERGKRRPNRPLFSPVRYKPGTKRGAKNVESVGLAVFDIDKGMSIEEAREKFAGLSYALYTTFNHAPKASKFRVVVPFTEPVPAEEWPAVWRAATARFAPETDVQTKDICRIFYLPCRASESSEFLYYEGEGAALDWRKLLAEQPEATKGAKKERTRKTRPAAVSAALPAERVSLDVLKHCLSQLNVLDYNGKRPGHANWFEAMQAFHSGCGGSPEGLALWTAWSLSDPDYAGDAEIIEQRWNSLDPDALGGVTFATLRKHVRAAGGKLPGEKAAEQFADGYQPQWQCKPNTDIKYVNVHNTIEAVRALGIKPARNGLQLCEEMRGDLSTLKKFAPGVGAFVGDAEISGIRYAILREHGFDPGKTRAWDAIEMEGGFYYFDPLREMVEGFEPWDGVPRIETFFIDYAHSPDTPLVRCYSVIFFLGAIARALVPGIKFDPMTILEGKQGCRKSSLLKVLAGPQFHKEMPMDKWKSEADVIAHMQGYWIIEYPELGSMRYDTVDKLKEFLSREEDRARMAYGRKPGNYPRRCVFAGTTNDFNYLKDRTGNRRFNPIPVGPALIDTDAAGRLREQLWAEARTLWQRDPRPEALEVPPELREAAEADRENRLTADARADAVDAWLDTFTGPVVSLPTALWESLGVVARNAREPDVKAVTETLGRRGWRKDRERPVPGGKKVQGYWRPGWLDKPAAEREREWAEWQRAQRVEPE